MFQMCVTILDTGACILNCTICNMLVVFTLLGVFFCIFHICMNNIHKLHVSGSKGFSLGIMAKLALSC